MAQKYFGDMRDVIDQVILPALGDYHEDYHVDDIAHQVTDYVPGRGLVICADEDYFWDVVERNEKE